MSQWYYMNAGQQLGPVTAKQLLGLALSGGLAPEDLVWTDTAKDWIPAGQVRGLRFPASGATQPPAATPLKAAAAVAAAPAPSEVQEWTASSPQPYESAPAADVVSAIAIEHLRQTRTWARIIAIFTFIMGAVLVVIPATFFVLLAIAAAAHHNDPDAAKIAGSSLLLIVLAVLAFFPAYFLMRFSSHITRLERSRRSSDLEAALAAQKSYFLFIGVLTIIFIVLGTLSLTRQLMELPALH